MLGPFATASRLTPNSRLV